MRRRGERVEAQRPGLLGIKTTAPTRRAPFESRNAVAVLALTAADYA